LSETLETKFGTELGGKILPEENAGFLPYKIMEIMDIKLLLEHSSLNTIMLLPTGFVLLKHYVYRLLKLHQVRRLATCMHGSHMHT